MISEAEYDQAPAHFAVIPKGVPLPIGQPLGLQIAGSVSHVIRP